MKRRTVGPVQQWIDSIPLSTRSEIAVASECREEEETPKSTGLKDIPFSKDSRLPSMTISAPINVPNSPAMSAPLMLPSSLPHHRLARDASFQSDSSHCSSVESLLELRKADPTAILFDLGFGGCTACPQDDGALSRIPKRFLQPSSLPGIAIDEFLKQQQETTESFDSVSLGYRGLTGSPHVAPSEIVQKIMERLRENESHDADTNLYNYEQYSPICHNGTLSVLSPDNRQFLEQSRSKSPDMRNKRMIIGQKSFAFGRDGNLIELPSVATKPTSNDAENDNHNNSDVSEEFAESRQSSLEEDITFEYRNISKNDKKLAKQLSFEFVETEQVSKSNREITLSNSHVAQGETNADDNEQQCNKSSSIIPKYEFPDTRRSSDSSCCIKSMDNKISDDGRRFSDSAVCTIKSLSTECTLMQKRKSFKRQSKVCDTTAIHYCDLSPISSSVSNAITESHVDCESKVSNDEVSLDDRARKLNIPILIEPTEVENDMESKMDKESEESNCTSSASKVCQSLVKIEHFEAAKEDTPSDHSSAEEDKICCFKGKICKNCKQSKNCPDCGCHVDKQKYLKKMEKIMQKNKKLEDMLARSRKEMAEIRDMLSSVLSVRMEPGF